MVAHILEIPGRAAVAGYARFPARIMDGGCRQVSVQGVLLRNMRECQALGSKPHIGRRASSSGR